MKKRPGKTYIVEVATLYRRLLEKINRDEVHSSAFYSLWKLLGPQSSAFIKHAWHVLYDGLQLVVRERFQELEDNMSIPSSYVANRDCAGCGKAGPWIDYGL